MALSFPTKLSIAEYGGTSGGRYKTLDYKEVPGFNPSAIQFQLIAHSSHTTKVVATGHYYPTHPSSQYSIYFTKPWTKRTYKLHFLYFTQMIELVTYCLQVTNREWRREVRDYMEAHKL